MHNRHCKLIAAIGAIILFTCAGSLEAQMRAGRRQKTSGRAARVNPLTRTLRTPSGGTPCRVIKVSYDQDDYALKLIVKPIARNTRILRLTVPPGDEPRIRLGDFDLEEEDVVDLLRKGLFCSVQWKYEDVEEGRKPIVKELIDLELEPFDVAGKIVEIDDTFITIRARPRDDAEWPHLTPPLYSSRQSQEKKRPRLLKLKLRTLDDITEFLDFQELPLEPWELVEGREVEASVILGRKEGILLNLQEIDTGDD